MAKKRYAIGVIGSGGPLSQEAAELAYDVGRHIALNDAVLMCGGLGGVMEAASRGAFDNKGIVVGIVPSENKADANPYTTAVIPSGMGAGRNVLVVRAADALIAFPGSFGTLSEIALAMNMGKTVIYMPGSWELGKIAAIDVSRFKPAFEPGQAVGLALDAAALGNKENSKF
jgi:hypothetical protein